MSRRVSLIIALVAAVGLVGGLGLLLLPYSTLIDVPGGVLPAGIQVPCKAPLIDAFTSEDDGAWINYAPDDGVSFGGGRTGGSDCYPESFRRSIIGSMVTISTLGLLMAVYLLDRRDREKAMKAAAGEAAAAGDEADAQAAEPVEADVVDSDPEQPTAIE